MKKLVTLLCMITCVFALTGCGEEKTLSEYEQSKLAYAENLATSQMVTFLADNAVEEMMVALEERTAEEVEAIVSQQQIAVDGNGFKSALTSFASGLEAIGGIMGIDGAEAVIDDKEIIVDVQITGAYKNAIAQIIFTNDMFMELKSAALNPIDTFEESMTKAGLNTAIGMGTVFAVLILISLIISAFGVINKLQNGAQKKAPAEKKAPAPAAPAAAPAPVVKQSGNLVSDLELVAVIAAAIAASEGATSTDGFVVRSIRRRAF